MTDDNERDNGVVTMAMSNYERQKRWRQKHPGLFNLRRKKKPTVDSIAPLTANSFTEIGPVKDKLASLRELMARASDAPADPVKPQVFRNDYGAVITEAQYNILQKKKANAKKGNYVIDDYSQ